MFECNNSHFIVWPSLVHRRSPLSLRMRAQPLRRIPVESKSTASGKAIIVNLDVKIDREIMAIILFLAQNKRTNNASHNGTKKQRENNSCSAYRFFFIAFFSRRDLAAWSTLIWIYFFAFCSPLLPAGATINRSYRRRDTTQSALISLCRSRARVPVPGKLKSFAACTAHVKHLPRALKTLFKDKLFDD